MKHQIRFRIEQKKLSISVRQQLPSDGWWVDQMKLTLSNLHLEVTASQARTAVWRKKAAILILENFFRSVNPL